MIVPPQSKVTWYWSFRKPKAAYGMIENQQFSDFFFKKYKFTIHGNSLEFAAEPPKIRSSDNFKYVSHAKKRIQNVNWIDFRSKNENCLKCLMCLPLLAGLSVVVVGFTSWICVSSMQKQKLIEIHIDFGIISKYVLYKVTFLWMIRKY